MNIMKYVGISLVALTCGLAGCRGTIQNPQTAKVDGKEIRYYNDGKHGFNELFVKEERKHWEYIDDDPQSKWTTDRVFIYDGNTSTSYFAKNGKVVYRIGREKVEKRNPDLVGRVMGRADSVVHCYIAKLDSIKQAEQAKELENIK